MKKIRSMAVLALVAVTAITACSKNDDNDVPGLNGTCFADKLSLTNPVVENLASQHSVIVTFDVKNTSSENFSISNGHKPVYIKISATTTNDKVYTEEAPLTVSSLNAGAMASAAVLVDYGPGNSYKSYKLEQVYCK
jgi:hypothetical protein